MSLPIKTSSLAVPTAVLVVLAACGTTQQSGRGGSRGTSYETRLGAIPEGQISAAQLKRDVNVRKDYIARGRYGRRSRKRINPSYITIHSTQNYTGDAYDHAKALKKGALRGGTYGYLCWHFTVQENVAIQHMPTTERGEHADFDGPGNNRSIGIEMCEHRGNDRARTIERTAKLTASLMYYHGIPLSRVVPHYHWPRRGKTPANKNCPHFLLDGGRPGATWRWFLSRVDRHYKRIQRG